MQVPEYKGASISECTGQYLVCLVWIGEGLPQSFEDNQTGSAMGVYNTNRPSITKPHLISVGTERGQLKNPVEVRGEKIDVKKNIAY